MKDSKNLANKVDIQKCAQKIGNKFELIIIAAHRARELSKRAGLSPHRHTVQALIDIQEGTVGREMLRRVRTKKKVLLA